MVTMIKAEKLTKRFDDITALDGITCTIPKGCVYGMVGSNGAGKSTFLRLAAGVYKPDGGLVTVDGMPIYENPEHKARIAYIADETYFLPGANLKKMAGFYAAGYPSFCMKRFTVLTDRFGLDIKKPLGSFSKGMRRQAAVILALSRRADYYLFDETFDGLDPIVRKLVRSLICDEVIENNSTVVVTSHSLRELEDTCDQLALLHRGGVVLESDVGNLKTSLFKIQVAFPQEYDHSLFDGLELVHFTKRGSVSNLIVRGDRKETVERLRVLQPTVLDALPLTLEEVFTYEMEALGYAFSETGIQGTEQAI
jgi:ABC-2 type transport system ATP-binding protein